MGGEGFFSSVAVVCSLEIMQEACSLPETFHPDPADRIITATARIHRIRNGGINN
ncbi:MAG: hypothetical protein JXX29_17800 [Deltaproteobacteria bacterium]|nr:hypothetical protein [Deltaproteobacteria bacterium]